MSERVVLTKGGAERLRDELNRLKRVERPRIIQAIAEARAHGDLSENAEYHAARDEQGFMEARIRQLEGCLSAAEIIDPLRLNAGNKVVFGAYVTLFDVDTEAEISYQIVGELEADLNQGQISIGSPIAKALLGRSEDDEISVLVPAGEKTYEIMKVEYR
ncbi:MAG: transcription elongation factor GreA [marine bacterium B5-7]|nr:MAG: transcription elongation factor GreA [marine bacterium B5-7]